MFASQINQILVNWNGEVYKSISNVGDAFGECVTYKWEKWVHRQQLLLSFNLLYTSELKMPINLHMPPWKYWGMVIH